MKKLVALSVFGLALVACGGGSSSITSKSVGTEAVQATTQSPETAAPAGNTTTISPSAPSTTTPAAPTTAPKVLSTECLLAIGENECAQTLTLYEDAGCPNPKADDINATRTAIMPCEYGYWVVIAEQELARQGYAVTADGYYSSTEIPAVQQAQSDAGVEADGQIGPATWRAVMVGLHCDAPDAIKAPILQGEMCWGDMNGDGMYDPGDLIPD